MCLTMEFFAGMLIGAFALLVILVRERRRERAEEIALLLRSRHAERIRVEPAGVNQGLTSAPAER